LDVNSIYTRKNEIPMPRIVIESLLFLVLTRLLHHNA